MVLGSHGNMLLGLPFKNRTCLWVQLDNCLQTQYLKICSNIPFKATLLPASPQSLSQHSSTTGAWSFLLNESSSNKQSLLWSSPLGWLRLCPLYITAWNSLPILLSRCAWWSEAFPAQFFPLPVYVPQALLPIHFSHFNSILRTTNMENSNWYDWVHQSSSLCWIQLLGSVSSSTYYFWMLGRLLNFPKPQLFQL